MPGGTVCCIVSCKSNAKKVKQTQQQIKFFNFPVDPDTRREWVRRCNRKDKFDPKNKRICSLHFKKDDYKDALYARLMNSVPTKLKKTAIPSKKLPRAVRSPRIEPEVLSTAIQPEVSFSTAIQPSLSGRQERHLKEEKEEFVEECLQQERPKAEQSEIKSEIREDETVHVKNQESEIGCLKQQVQALQAENESLKNRLLMHENNEITLKNKCEELEKKFNLKFEETAKVVFKDLLSANQIDVALKKKQKARWTQEELSKAFTIRYFSKRCYLYLKNTLHYPLPGISTLQQWAGNINLRSGFLEDVITVMGIIGKSKTALQRVAVLAFDEMKVCSRYEYDQKTDEVVGPHSYMQVVIVRGLFDTWKQPIYVGFDQKVTKLILEEVIVKLYEVGYEVVVCVSDCGGSNQGLWKTLNISIDHTFIVHPVTSQHIFFFADVPHMLKLLRNWFLDTGFVLKNGKEINAIPVRKLISDTTTSEVRSCYKLTPLHVACEKTQRQNVRLAAELLSNTTATALKQYLPGENKELAQNVGDFIYLVNTWFDIFNSYVPIAKVPTQMPYGTKLEFQNETLETMKTTMRDMLCIGKNTLQVFQKGIIISSTSLQLLFEDLKARFGITYILTHRLNQDCLENFFSQLRTRGGLHDHPSPLNALYRMRMILLGKTPGLEQTHTNVTATQDNPDDKEEYLVATALKQAKIMNISVSQPDSDIYAASKYDSSSSTSSDTSDVMEMCEKDRLLYITGYLAHKHLREYPHLGT